MAAMEAHARDAGFNPRIEIPDLLERIGELAAEFRDVFEGNANPNLLTADATELRRACMRLSDVAFALTATALVNVLGAL